MRTPRVKGYRKLTERERMSRRQQRQAKAAERRRRKAREREARKHKRIAKRVWRKLI